jgi:hypothetical protein
MLPRAKPPPSMSGDRLSKLFSKRIDYSSGEPAAAQTPREVSTIFTVRSRTETSSQSVQFAM